MPLVYNRNLSIPTEACKRFAKIICISHAGALLTDVRTTNRTTSRSLDEQESG
jgi:hypothetical protein